MKTIDMEIRFTDVDSQNHVNHTAIVEWIAHARVKLIDEKVNQYDHGSWEDKDKDKDLAIAMDRVWVDFDAHSDLDYVLVNLDINFRKEVLYPGTVDVKGGVLNVGNKSLTTEFFVYSNDDLVAEAQCINVFFRTSTKKSVDIPNKLKDILMKKMVVI